MTGTVCAGGREFPEDLPVSRRQLMFAQHSTRQFTDESGIVGGLRRARRRGLGRAD